MRNRTLAAVLLLLSLVSTPVFSKTLNLPEMSPEEAIALAKKYVSENKLGVGGEQYFLESIEYRNLYEELVKPCWRLRWREPAATKGGSFYLDVYADGTITVQHER